MSHLCAAMTQDGQRCTHLVRGRNPYCWQHTNGAGRTVQQRHEAFLSRTIKWMAGLAVADFAAAAAVAAVGATPVLVGLSVVAWAATIAVAAVVMRSLRSAKR